MLWSFIFLCRACYLVSRLFIVHILITGSPTYSVVGQYCFARWRLSFVVICNTPRPACWTESTIFRLTPQNSRPNKVNLKCLYVRPPTKSFFNFNEIWHVGRGRWVMHNGMQYDLIGSSSRALESWKSFHFPKLSFPSFTVGAGNWPLILKLRHNIWIWSGRIFVFFLFFVSRDFELGRNSSCRVDCQSCMWLIFVLCPQ